MKTIALALIALVLAPAGALAADDAAVFALYRRAHEAADRVRPQLHGFDATRRARLFEHTVDHPVASLDRLPHYDPDGLIGFCFGRAMAAHLGARMMGLAEAGVRKLFIVGDLRQYGADRTEWRFHVTTLVRGDDRDWYAIDPIVGRVMTAKRWIQFVQRTWDLRRKAKLYVTRAAAVLPDVRVTPAPEAETGARIIELAFDPRGRAGFTPRPELSPAAYELADAQVEAFFLDADEPTGRFDFVDITINGMTIAYRDYFRELLSPRRARVSAMAARALAKPRRVGLGSPDFSRLIRR